MLAFIQTPMKRLLLILFLLVSISGFTQIDTEKSVIKFQISNTAFNTVEGTFTGMTGTVSFDPKNLTNSKFDVCVDASSVNTENEKRDNHLRKEDFFFVEKYPKICFSSAQIVKTTKGYKVTGDLTMHGTTKVVEVPFTYSDKIFIGELTLDRQDYGVGGNSVLVGDEVELEIVCTLK